MKESASKRPERKKTKILTVSVPNETRARLDDYCKHNQIPKSTVVNIALTAFFSGDPQRTDKNPVSNALVLSDEIEQLIEDMDTLKEKYQRLKKGIRM